jgi:hypothetical protein
MPQPCSRLILRVASISAVEIPSAMCAITSAQTLHSLADADFAVKFRAITAPKAYPGASS